MAHSIEYQVAVTGKLSSGQEIFVTTGPLDKSDPENYKAVASIILNSYASTEITFRLSRQELLLRWLILTNFDDVSTPEMPLYSAVAYIEAIWIDTLLEIPHGLPDPFDNMYSENAYALNIASSFDQAINDEILTNFHDHTKHSKAWLALERQCIEAGVEHKVRAWVDGVPLEDVIA